MKNNSKFLALTACSIASIISLNACTNPTAQAGSVGAVYDGVIVNMEAVDMDANQQASGTNALIGGVLGALLGNALNNHSTGTAVGAGLGMLAGSAYSGVADRTTGIRLLVDLDIGEQAVDVPFSCMYAVGKKVKIVTGSNQGNVLVENNGQFVTATKEDPSKCPTLLGTNTSATK